MAKNKTTKQPKAVTVGVWLPIDELAAIKAAADKADRTVSNYIRLALRDTLYPRGKAS